MNTVTLTVDPKLMELLERLPSALERSVTAGAMSKADAERLVGLLAEILQRSLKVV